MALSKGERQGANPTKSPDVEMCADSSEVVNTGGLKRDLGSRHINMIALAGMIVSSLLED